MLLYVVCTAGEFVWNEGGVVPAPIMQLNVFFLVYQKHVCLNDTFIFIEKVSIIFHIQLGFWKKITTFEKSLPPWSTANTPFPYNSDLTMKRLIFFF